LTAVAELARRENIAVLLVEQAIAQALEFADHVYVMRNGEIVADHTREEALARSDWWEVF
jgi:ABC-type branched-subunit amino acid transport system ATPase component